jgi:hypothetical protein
MDVFCGVGSRPANLFEFESLFPAIQSTELLSWFKVKRSLDNFQVVVFLSLSELGETNHEESESQIPKVESRE